LFCSAGKARRKAAAKQRFRAISIPAAMQAAQASDVTNQEKVLCRQSSP